MKKYYVSKYLWIPFVVAFSGIFILFSALFDYIMFSGLKTVEGDNLSKLKHGQYVELSFDELLMNNAGYPVCGIYSYAFGNYYRVVIDNDDTYIQVEFSQTSNVLKELEKFEAGKGEEVTIIAKVVWSDVMKLEPDLVPNADEKAMYNNVIREVSKDDIADKFKGSMLCVCLLFVISFLLLFTPIGIHPAADMPFEKTKRFKELLLTYNKEGELNRALKRREELREKQGRMKMRFFVYVLVAIFGFAGFLRLYITFEQTFPIYSTAFMAVIFFFGMIQAWKSLLNSAWNPALSISKTFSVNSIPVQIEETSIIIGALKRKINEDGEE